MTRLGLEFEEVPALLHGRMHDQIRGVGPSSWPMAMGTPAELAAMMQAAAGEWQANAAEDWTARKL